MNPDFFTRYVDYIIKDVEERIGKPMSEEQKNGLYGGMTVQFVETMANDFYDCKSDREVDAWLKSLEKLSP